MIDPLQHFNIQTVTNFNSSIIVNSITDLANYYCFYPFLAYLDLQDLVNSRLVCRQWKLIIDDESIMALFFYKALGYKERIEGCTWKETYQIIKSNFIRHPLTISYNKENNFLIRFDS